MSLAILMLLLTCRTNQIKIIYNEHYSFGLW